MDKHTFDIVFSTIVVLNYGRDCWRGCGRRQGPCEWCGSGLCCRKGWWENRQLPPLASARVPLASDVNTPPCITQLWKYTSVYNTTVRENKTVKTQIHVNSEIEPLSNTTEKTQLPQHDRHQCPLGLCSEHNSV